MDRERLARLLGMMGSHHDGEVLNAARLAVRLIREAKLTWPEILDGQDGVATDAARVLLAENDALRAANEELQDENARLRKRASQTPRVWRQPRSEREQIEQAIEWTAQLTDWEREFVTSIAGRRRLTERQQSRLDEISKKIALIARVRGIAA